MNVGEVYISHVNGEHYKIKRIDKRAHILICFNLECGENVMFRETFFVNNFERAKEIDE